jgi:hypothetical protein
MTPQKDARVTMKVERPLWNRMQRLIDSHPEWGILSVPEFVRRAIDSEIRARKEEESRRVISVCLSRGTKGKRRKAP